jgi:3-deoxy-D-arabino-heptulosonate 7-phosphate (DAHP) synthase
MANAENQIVESKVVNERISRLEWEKNRICKNAGITRHVHESKPDTGSGWRGFIANP